MTQWSPQQDAALKEVDHWYKNRRNDQQVFRLFGHAGTGKTTLARHFASNINGLVRFATFTGKAAHVMASKGCEGASTIHRLIYRPKITSTERLKNLEKELFGLENIASPWSEIHLKKLDQVKRQIEEEQRNAGRMSFSLNLESELKQAKLLIIDEVSMLNEFMGRDLESFGIPILVLGDPEQLPPIHGAGYFTEQEPDIMLTEIHRQARENPIIELSRLVREGGTIPLGNYGDSKVVDAKLDEEEILAHNIILTGLVKTKQACNARCRTILGKDSPLPMLGDKLICVKNHHAAGLLNGQIWESQSDAVGLGGGVLSVHIKDPDGELEERAVTISEKLLRGMVLKRWEHEEDIEEFEYAYAITVHKAQGSQWNKVLLIDQKERFNSYSERDKRRWLYTGITRAAERITVMRL